MKNSQRWHTLAPVPRQHGLSLVELLIGIAIGLLVMLAALGTLSFTRVSSITVTDTVRIQQDASIAMNMIGNQLRQARAIALQDSVPGTGVPIVSYAAYTGMTPPGAPGEVAIFGQEGATVSDPDTVMVSFGIAPGLASTTCLGFASNLPNTVTSRFDVNAGSLRCLGSDGNGTQDVIDNVEDFQVWYGVRDGLTNNVQYRTATQVGVVNWATVGSVLVCLRIVGTTNTAPIPVGVAPLQGCRGENIAWDGSYRKVFRQVFTLRNPA